MFILAIEKHKIIGENIYNFDKRRFIIGVDIIFIQVMSFEKMRNKKIIRTS